MAGTNLGPPVLDASARHICTEGSATMTGTNLNHSIPDDPRPQYHSTNVTTSGEDQIDQGERGASNESSHTTSRSPRRASIRVIAPTPPARGHSQPTSHSSGSEVSLTSGSANAAEVVVAVDLSGSDISITSGSAEQAAPIALGPLKSFELFPLLPIEIRFMIWPLVALHPRIIEMRASSDEIVARIGYISTATTTAISSTVPAMLHVSKEAREEGLKSYSLRTFCTSRRICRPTYFNNQIDILLFGKGCRAAGLMKKVFQQTTTVDLPVERIAIAMEEVSSHQKLLDMMGDIHGFPGGTYTGCHGVKEITFVPPTKLWGCQPGNIDRSWTLVPTANGGLSYHHISIRRMIGTIIRVLETTTTGSFSQRLSDWVRSTNPEKPVFRFASLRPVGGEGNKTRDGLNVTVDELENLTSPDSQILTIIQAAFGIEIDAFVSTNSLNGYSGRSTHGPPNRCMEVGIVGENRFQVKEGIAAIKQYLDSV